MSYIINAKNCKMGKENWGNKGPPISDSILNDIVYYCLLEGIVTTIIFNDIVKNAEAGNNKVDRKNSNRN